MAVLFLINKKVQKWSKVVEIKFTMLYNKVVGVDLCFMVNTTTV